MQGLLSTIPCNKIVERLWFNLDDENEEIRCLDDLQVAFDASMIEVKAIQSLQVSESGVNCSTLEDSSNCKCKDFSAGKLQENSFHAAKFN